MDWICRLVCVSALGLVPLVGCGETSGAMTEAFPCTEQGIRDAIAEGGGPHTFNCGGPATVVTGAEIVIDKNVVLDGESNLTVDGNNDHTVFVVPEFMQVELDGFVVIRGEPVGIGNGGALTMANSIVRDSGMGIGTSGTTLVRNSAISDNSIGMVVYGRTKVIGTTVSNNDEGGIALASEEGSLTLTDSTVVGNGGPGGIFLGPGRVFITNSTISGNGECGIVWNCLEVVHISHSTIYPNGICAERDCGAGYKNALRIFGSIVGGCEGSVDYPSDGYNIESPGDTCSFHLATDQLNVSAEGLALGTLQNNGGPTMTHALLPGSVAIDQILETDCGYARTADTDNARLTTDQRGEPRPETGGTMCDVGAFEVQP